MHVKNISFEDNKLKLELKGEEDLIGTYYLKDEEELEYLKTNLEYGDLVFVKGKLSVPSRNTVPKAFNYQEFLLSKNIFYTIKIDSIEIRSKDKSIINRLKNIINKRIKNVDYKGYLKAFILGDKSNIDSTIYTSYQCVGIAHLFALSGMHVGLLSNLLLKLLKKLDGALKYLIIDLILICYGFLVSFPFSILRCILFFVINSINKILNLELKSFHILIIVFSLIALSNPLAVKDIGFLYSICTVGGIIICKNFITDRNKFKEMIKLSIVAFLFSLPISLFSFYEINLLGIIYNLIFIPLVSFIIYPLALLNFLFPIMRYLFKVIIDLFEYIVFYLASIKTFSLYLDFNRLQIFIWYLSLLTMYKFKNNYLAFGLVIIFILDLFIPYFDRSTYLSYLDVGQGDATLLITRKRRDVVLIDTGGLNTDYFVSDNYISYLKSLGIKKIDTLILTHGDNDHMGDSRHLLDNFKVGRVIFNCGEFNDLEKELIKVLDEKKIKYYSCIRELSIGNNRLSFLQTKEYDNENDNSNVIYTELNGYKFMFMGDASITTEKEILSKFNLPDIDVLKVGHHGSRTSSSKEFIKTIKPRYSIISVGKNNRYGHPNKEVIKILNKSKIYRTDLDGSIMLKIKDNKLKIETCILR